MKKLMFMTIASLLMSLGAQAQSGHTPKPEDFPGGLADDGRGPDELPYGQQVKYDGDDYIKVYTAEQFVNALRSNVCILVAKDTEINLTPYLSDNSNFRTRFRQWRPEGSTEVGNLEVLISEEVFDGRQLTIVNMKQTLIEGEGNSKIIVAPRYALCLNFVNCDQIEIRNLTIGHTEGGYCQGGVVGVKGGWRVSIRDCDLYGCGTYGVQLERTSDFSMYNSIIRECSYGIMTLQNVEHAKFERCDFFNNKEYDLIESRGSEVVFYDCRFFANWGDAVLFNIDREFYLNKCYVYHPLENLGAINLADKEGTFFSPNPIDPNIESRGIGPKVKQ